MAVNNDFYSYRHYRLYYGTCMESFAYMGVTINMYMCVCDTECVAVYMCV